MPSDKKTNLREVLREECLPALSTQAAYFSVADVRDWLRQHSLTCPPGLLREYLSGFMRGGGVHDAGRGWYSTLATPFTLNREPVASLVQELKKKFPSKE